MLRSGETLSMLDEKLLVTRTHVLLELACGAGSGLDHQRVAERLSRYLGRPASAQVLRDALAGVGALPEDYVTAIAAAYHAPVGYFQDTNHARDLESRMRLCIEIRDRYGKRVNVIARGSRPLSAAQVENLRAFINEAENPPASPAA